MNTDDIRARIEAAIGVEKMDMQADGNRLQLAIVSNDFSGLNRVKRQQLIYAVLNELISSGEIHAVSMQTLTVDEAE